MLLYGIRIIELDSNWILKSCQPNNNRNNSKTDSYLILKNKNKNQDSYLICYRQLCQIKSPTDKSRKLRAEF